MGVDGGLHRHRDSFMGNGTNTETPSGKPDHAGDGRVSRRDLNGDGLDGYNAAYVDARAASVDARVDASIVANPQSPRD
jgi:hypothetical protein